MKNRKQELLELMEDNAEKLSSLVWNASVVTSDVLSKMWDLVHKRCKMSVELAKIVE